MKTKGRALAVLLLCTAAAGSAWAYRGHGHGHAHNGHGGINIAIGAMWGGWYPPLTHRYPYYYAPVVVERIATPVYIERLAPPPSTPPAHYWYYCATAGGYYPYVRECPGGWQRVSPTPPGQP